MICKMLEGKIDDVCDHIIDGIGMGEIADMFNVAKSTLYQFLLLDENLLKTRVAMQLSAHSYAELALQALFLIDDENIVSVAKQREIAQHYRWMAGVRSPKTHGKSPEQEKIPEKPRDYGVIQSIADKLNDLANKNLQLGEGQNYNTNNQ